jgi:hypothetical protein
MDPGLQENEPMNTEKLYDAQRNFESALIRDRRARNQPLYFELLLRRRRVRNRLILGGVSLGVILTLINFRNRRIARHEEAGRFAA